MREAFKVIASDTMLDVQEEAMADAELGRQIKADPRAYLRSKDVRIPDNVKFEVTEKSPWCWRYFSCSPCGCGWVEVCSWQMSF